MVTFLAPQNRIFSPRNAEGEIRASGCCPTPDQNLIYLKYLQSFVTPSTRMEGRWSIDVRANEALA